MATSSILSGASNTGAALNGSADVSGLTLSDANFSTAVTDGSVTVNGAIVNIASTDTLQEVFDNINTATGGAVTGSYNPATDKVELSSASEIVLGSAADSSNFLQVARLYNNGSGAIESDTSLGSAQLTGTLADGNFATPISDGGAGAGEFKINCVSINFDTSTLSLQNVIDQINDSEAGVLASFDSVSDRLILSNKSTGDLGVALEDVTGNFLTATGLIGGTLDRGDNLEYTVNGGGTIKSYSNSVSDSSSGVVGVSFDALQLGTTTITVDQDTDAMEAGINGFIEQYNKVQGFIETNTDAETDADGKVKAGILQGEREALDVASGLRSIVVADVPALSEALNRLNDLTIETNGYDNNLALNDADALREALQSDPASVKALFQSETDGLAVRLRDFLDGQIGDDGILNTKTDNLTEQSAGIDTQIAQMERLVQSNIEQLEASFLSMETAQQQINQQMQFLSQRFGGGGQ